MNEFDINTGTDSVLGVISEPGILGIIADATGFDSNNGILYYVGYDGNSLPIACISIPVRESCFFLVKDNTSDNRSRQQLFQCEL